MRKKKGLLTEAQRLRMMKLAGMSTGKFDSDLDLWPAEETPQQAWDRRRLSEGRLTEMPDMEEEEPVAFDDESPAGPADDFPPPPEADAPADDFGDEMPEDPEGEFDMGAESDVTDLAQAIATAVADAITDVTGVPVEVEGEEGEAEMELGDDLGEEPPGEELPGGDLGGEEAPPAPEAGEEEEDEYDMDVVEEVFRRVADRIRVLKNKK